MSNGTTRSKGKKKGGPASAGRRPSEAPGAKKPAEVSATPWSGLGIINLAIFLAAVAVIVLAYVLLDRGSVTAAPILLILGYVVLLPASILWGYRRV